MQKKKEKKRKSSKQRPKVCFQIRTNACSLLAQNKTTHVKSTKYHVTADPHPEPCRSFPWCQRYPKVTRGVWKTRYGCIMWVQFFTPSLTRVWPSHWVSSLCRLTQRLPNICSLSESRLIQQRRHWVASQRASPSGGWLSGRMWADSCPGDWRNERWSRLADRCYLPCCPRRREGSLIWQMDDIQQMMLICKHRGERGREGKKNLLHTENSETTPARDLT